MQLFTDNQRLYLTYRGLPTHPETGKRMTITAASALAGVTRQAVDKWREDERFKEAEKQAVKEGIAGVRQVAKAGVSALMDEAIMVAGRLLSSPDHKVRAQVALKIMEWGGAPDPTTVNVQGDLWGGLLHKLAEAGVEPEAGAEMPEDEDE